MTSRAATILGYGLLLGAAIVLQLVALRGRPAVAPLSTVTGRLMRSRAGRLALLACWAWLGLHFFAR